MTPIDGQMAVAHADCAGRVGAGGVRIAPVDDGLIIAGILRPGRVDERGHFTAARRTRRGEKPGVDADGRRLVRDRECLDVGSTAARRRVGDGNAGAALLGQVRGRNRRRQLGAADKGCRQGGAVPLHH